MPELTQWAVYWNEARQPRAKGKTRQEDHPVILVTSTAIVQDSKEVQVVPISSRFGERGAIRRTVLPLSREAHPFLDHDSFALTHRLFRMEKQTLARWDQVGELSPLVQRALQDRLRFLFGLPAN